MVMPGMSLDSLKKHKSVSNSKVIKNIFNKTIIV